MKTLTLAQAFIWALGLKILFACIAAFSGLFIWGLGFWIPVAVMVAYMAYGWKLTKNSSYSEKISYGDSCYFLGFLFTVASIILALYSIATSGNGFDVAEVAIRFAAAMVTTLIGMAVRVYLVTFAKKPLTKDAQETNLLNQVIVASDNDGQEFCIEANLKNLKLLNKSLVINLQATEKIRASMVDLLAKVSKDLETSAKSFKHFAEDQQQALKDEMATMATESHEAYEQLKKENSKMLSETSKETLKIFDKLAQSCTERVEGFGEQLQESVKKIDSPLEEFAKKINLGTLPTDEWQRSLSNVSTKLDNVVDKFEEKVSAAMSASNVGEKNLQAMHQKMTEEVGLAMKEFREVAQTSAQRSKDCSDNIEKVLTEVGEKLQVANKNAIELAESIENTNKNAELGSSVFKKLRKLFRGQR